MATIVFYHYTDTPGKNSIIFSGKIEASTDGLDGPGVYGTTLSPEQGRAALAKNNWDTGSRWEKKIRDGMVDWAFKIILPQNRVKRVKDSRIVLIHKGDIHLNEHKYELLKVPE